MRMPIDAVYNYFMLMKYKEKILNNIQKYYVIHTHIANMVK